MSKNADNNLKKMNQEMQKIRRIRVQRRLGARQEILISLTSLQKGFLETLIYNYCEYATQVPTEDATVHLLKYFPKKDAIEIVRKAGGPRMTIAKANRVLDFEKWDDSELLDKKKFRFQCLKECRKYLQPDLIWELNEDAEIEDKRFLEMIQVFELGEIDAWMMMHQFLYRNEKYYEDLYDHLFGIPSSSENLSEMRRFFNASPYSYSEFKTAFQKDCHLQKSGLVNDNLTLEDELSEWLTGTRNGSIKELFFRICPEPALTLEEHLLPKTESENLLHLVQSHDGSAPLNILLSGIPGAGKTELAKTLIHLAGYNCYEIIQEESKFGEIDNGARIENIQKSRYLLKPDEDGLLVDEADDLLNSRYSSWSTKTRLGGKKEMINKLLETNNVFRVWIVNDDWAIHPAIMRRFDYSLQFKQVREDKRRIFWKNILSKHGFVEAKPDILDWLVAQESVTPGGMDVILSNFKRIGGDISDEKSHLSLKDFTKKYLERMGVIKKPKPEIANSRNYSLEGLNISGDIDQSLKTMERFLKVLKQSLKDDEEPLVRNMNILLDGAPGTGKTEFAKYIARHLGAPMIQKRASDLLGMFVGQSEELINAMFQEAEDSNSILFVDEADSLLYQREEGQRSWEKSLVNEFLSCMESFKGILVCATNFPDGLDTASLRRFNLRHHFNPLTSKGNLIFYKRVLLDMVNEVLSEPDEDKIRQLKGLVPGDFKVAWQRNVFLDKKEIGHSLLIKTLEESCRDRKGEVRGGMGFV